MSWGASWKCYHGLEWLPRGASSEVRARAQKCYHGPEWSPRGPLDNGSGSFMQNPQDESAVGENMKLMRFGLVAMIPVLWLGASTLAAAPADRWVDNGNGTLTDTRDGRVWTQRDNQKTISFTGARRYCDTLSLAGGHWRLPSLEEVTSVFRPGDERVPCGRSRGIEFTCKVPALFALTGAFFWSATLGNASDPPNQSQSQSQSKGKGRNQGQGRGQTRIWTINYTNGDQNQFTGSNANGLNRVLCVRSP